MNVTTNPDNATIRDAFATAELWQIIALSLSVSVSAAAIATVLGLPWRRLGGLAVPRPPVWRSSRQFAAGLAAGSDRTRPLPAALAHTGPLGWLGLLFTPTAMVIAQAVLALPIVTALGHRAAEDLWAEYGDALLVFGAGKSRAIPS